jgi:hypothetical protein
MGLVRPDDEQRGRSIEVISLELELKQQAKRYMELGFHRELGLTEQEYLESLPKFFTQPESYKGRFDTPLLVETRIPAARLADLSSFEDPNYYAPGGWYLDLLDWEGDPKKFRIPNKPYTTWLNNSEMNLKESVDMIRANLKEDERMATIFDGIALYTSQPGILETRNIIFGGSVFKSGFESGSVPWLRNWYDRPGLDSLDANEKLQPGYGNVTCGRKLGFKD